MSHRSRHWDSQMAALGMALHSKFEEPQPAQAALHLKTKRGTTQRRIWKQSMKRITQYVRIKGDAKYKKSKQWRNVTVYTKAGIWAGN